MLKKHPPLTYELFVESLDEIPKQMNDLIDAIKLAINGNGSKLANMILNGDVINQIPKELLAELIRNTKKSPRPTQVKMTERGSHFPIVLKSGALLYGRSRTVIATGPRIKQKGRPKNHDTLKRDSQIYNDYRALIKTSPKWKCLRTLSLTHHLSESTIEDILKIHSSLEKHGYAHAKNGRTFMTKWYLWGKPRPEMGDKSE